MPIKKYPDSDLCISCMRRLGLAKPDRPYRKKMSESATKRHKEEAEKSAIKGLFSDVVMGVLFPKNFDLAEHYQQAKQVCQTRPENNLYPEMFAFSQWWYSDKSTRKPKQLAVVSQILGITDRTLKRWAKSEITTVMRRTALEYRLRTGVTFDLYAANLIRGLEEGKDKSVEMYAKQILEKPARNAEEKNAMNAVKEFMEEAKAIVGDIKRISQRGMPKALSDKVVASGAVEIGSDEPKSH